jgi:hypothetical protein
VNENVISVNFSDDALIDEIAETGDDFPRRVSVELGEAAYTSASEEEELTGMNKTTITNRALQVYRLVMEKQRQGQSIGFLNPEAMTVDLWSIDDPQ